VNATRGKWPELLTGLGIMIAGIVIGFEATQINVIPIYAKVGPSAFLWFAGGLLLLCGAIVAWRAAPPPDQASELRGPLYILGGLIASAFLMEVLGFIPVAAIIFALTARGLGSASLLRDLVIGVAIAAVSYVVFDLGLDLRLPLGWLFT
jgi:putative tricarboxylic transport membrane protein